MELEIQKLISVCRLSRHAKKGGEVQSKTEYIVDSIKISNLCGCEITSIRVGNKALSEPYFQYMYSSGKISVVDSETIIDTSRLKISLSPEMNIYISYIEDISGNDVHNTMKTKILIDGFGSYYANFGKLKIEFNGSFRFVAAY